MVTNMRWNYEKVYAALVARGERVKESPRNRYVVLYPQDKNCAVLYAPESDYAKKGPLHLNPNRDAWRCNVFKRLEPAIQYVGKDNKGPGKESQNFRHYRIIDWSGFAKALDLKDR